MKTIKEFQRELRKMADELEQLSAEKATKVGNDFNWKNLSELAHRDSIENHPLMNEEQYVKKRYLCLLLSVAGMENEVIEESLLFIYKIALGCKYIAEKQSLTDEFIASQTMDFETLDETTRLFGESELRLLLIAESLIIAVGFQNQKQDVFQYISDLCVLLKVEKKELEIVSNIAKAICTNDETEYKCDTANPYSVFDCYISKIKIERSIVSLESVLSDEHRNIANSYNNNDKFRNKYYVFIKAASYSISYEICEPIRPARFLAQKNLEFSTFKRVNSHQGTKEYTNPVYVFEDERKTANGDLLFASRGNDADIMPKEAKYLSENPLNTPIAAETSKLDSYTLCKKFYENI